MKDHRQTVTKKKKKKAQLGKVLGGKLIAKHRLIFIELEWKVNFLLLYALKELYLPWVVSYVWTNGRHGKCLTLYKKCVEKDYTSLKKDQNVTSYSDTTCDTRWDSESFISWIKWYTIYSMLTYMQNVWYVGTNRYV